MNKPIALFDSGVGGISVLRELVKILPNEDYIYYGDNPNNFIYYNFFNFIISNNPFIANNKMHLNHLQKKPS